MEFGFLFWFFLSGIIVASMMDLKRREVDNWLNLFLIVGSFVFVGFGAILSGDLDIIFHAGFLFVVMFVVMNLFYEGRVFAGGDAKLLLAMTMFFICSSFYGSIINVGVFLLFLMISGSVYGLVYSLVLWIRDFEKINEEIASQVAGRRSQVLWGLVWFYFCLDLLILCFLCSVLCFLYFLYCLFLLKGWRMFL